MLLRSLAVTVLVVLAGAGAISQSQPPGASGPPAPSVAKSPRNANYTINVRLDHPTRTLTGDAVLTWRNVSSRPATSLRFHLYYNAWRNNRSSWMREQRLAGDGDFPVDAAAWGSIDVKSLKLVASDGGSIDLTSTLRFISPDDGNPDDRTVIEAPLDRAIEPGQSIELQMTWASRVPRPFARTGSVGDYYFLAHWFPKIGVLQDDGWNCHQFHAATEFFADFGVYDVSITVPRDWVVGATGLERDRRDTGDGTTTHRYVAEDVHDFAWTTSPRYIERNATFEHPRLPSVAMRLLLQPEHAGQAERHFEATRAALQHYGEWFGAYPYGYLTIVDPAWQSGAGGMEYPTLFTAGTDWLTSSAISDLEAVTVHEAGHQFWHGVVASNEVEDAWLDEGLNQFAEARVVSQRFGYGHYTKRYFGGFIPWVFDDVALSRIDGEGVGRYLRAGPGDAQSVPTWRYWPRTATAVSYVKTALWLHTLENMLGWDMLQRILATYYERWAFRHPKPDDFFAVANEVSGQDLTWFFDQVHRSSSRFDYGVDRFTSEADSPHEESGRDERRSGPEASSARYRTSVVARRHGDGIFPVDVKVVFENGTEERWRWDGSDRWKLFEVETPTRAVSAQVDPDRVLLLDVNYTNNSAALSPATARRAARKWSFAWLIWVQDHLLTYGFFI